MATTKRTSSSAKKSKSAATRKKNEQQRNAKRQMNAVIWFAIGIFTGALAIIPGASLWNWLHNLLYGLFGWGSILIAVLILYLAWLMSTGKPVRGRAWMGAFLAICVCGAIQIFRAGLPETEHVVDMLVECVLLGISGKSGGLCGAIIGLPLLLSFGKIGAGVTIVLLIFVFAMLLTGGTLVGLVRAAQKPAQKIEESYIEQVGLAEERRHAREEKRRKTPDEKPAAGVPAASVYAAANAPKAVVHGHVSQAQESSETTLKVPRERSSIDISIDDDFVPEETGGFSLVPSGEVPIEAPIEAPVEASIDALVHKAAAAEPEAAKLPSPEAQELDAPSAPLSAQERGKPDEAIQQELNEKLEAPPVPLYVKPSVGLLNEPRRKNDADITEEMKANAQRLVDTLASFGVQTRIVDIARGPAVTRYELQPSAGVKISKITSLADDIALNLASAGVRIEAPIPNKAAVGIEVPNKVVSSVTLREIIDSEEFQKAQSKLTVALGRDIAGNVVVADLAKMPHLLIAGSTGSGKSVCINSIIMSLLFKSTPEEVRLLMVDPKVVELGIYNGIPQLLVPVVTDPKKAAGALSWAVTEMLKRYKQFADNSVRDLASYNKLAEKTPELEKLPQVVIIIDELADLMMAAPSEIEDYICRLAQMARAAGMHLIIATQRPSVDVITGVIKANIASRAAFAVSSQVDSRTILDMGGAEKLLGRGDMLFNPVGAAKPIRVQGCFVTDREIENVISFIKNDSTADYDESIASEIESHVVATKGKGGAGSAAADSDGDADDEMLIPAIECVVEAGMASTSLLQRRLKLGYARAARIVDAMESRGIVGPFEGSKPRQVLISPERWAEMKMNMMD